MTDKNNPQGFEILERVCATVTQGERYVIIQAKCNDTNETVWVTGDDQVCAVTGEDFLRGKLDYNSVLIQEFPLKEHNPENVGRWKPLIEDFVETMLTSYMEHDGLVHVYPQWLPEHAYAHYGKEMFTKMCEGCDHIILHVNPQMMDFVLKTGKKKQAETMLGENAANITTAKAINGEIRRGDYVIATGNNDYAYLLGEVIEILKHGTPEHATETDNDTDSVHVNFLAFSYPPHREIAIIKYFNALCNSDDVVNYDELPIDDVIMAPDMLIRITGLDANTMDSLLCDYDEAKSFCDNIT